MACVPWREESDHEDRWNRHSCQIIDLWKFQWIEDNP